MSNSIGTSSYLQIITFKNFDYFTEIASGFLKEAKVRHFLNSQSELGEITHSL